MCARVCTFEILLGNLAGGMPGQRVRCRHHLGTVYSQIDLRELGRHLQRLRERHVSQKFAHLRGKTSQVQPSEFFENIVEYREYRAKYALDRTR